MLLWTAALRLARRAPLALHHRLVPATAAGAFLLQLAFRGLYHGDWLANSARAKLLPLAFALPAGLADLARAASLAATVPAQRRAVAAEGTWVRFWSEVGSALRAAVPPGTRIALCPVGALPYHSRLPVVDMLGLTDRHIARVAPDRSYAYPGHQRHDGAYVLARRPELVMLVNGPRVGRRLSWAARPRSAAAGRARSRLPGGRR